jgi:hypothetical protein
LAVAPDRGNGSASSVALVAAAANLVQEQGYWPLAVGYWQKQINLQWKRLLLQMFPLFVAVVSAAVAVVSLACRRCYGLRI